MEEFQSLNLFCNSLKKELGAKSLFFSPGNHDLNWVDNLQGNVDLMEDLIDSGQKGIDRVERRFERESDRINLRSGMSSYYNFIKNMNQESSLYLYSLKSFIVEKFKINFISLNSAYLFSKKYAYFGYIGETQINHATNEADSVGSLESDYRVFNICMFHHPFEAIAPAAQEATENLIKGRSDIILTGHVHSLRAYIDITSSLIGRHNTRSHPIICGARCVYDEVRDPHIVPGYSILNLTFDQDEVKKVLMYEVSYDKNKMEWIRDPNNPISPFVIPGNDTKFIDFLTTDQNELPKLKMGNINEVASWGWNSIELLNELEKIDYEVIEGLKPEDEGDTDSWAKIRINHPDTWRVLYTSPKEIGGYWSYVPLFPDSFKLLKYGKITEGQITESMVPIMEIPGHYKIFFTMIALREKFRGTSSIHLLYYSFFKIVEDLANQGIFFDELAANAYTPAGMAICKSFGMQYVADSPSKGKIFSIPLYPLPKSKALNEHPKLLAMYEEEFKNNDRNAS